MRKQAGIVGKGRLINEEHVIYKIINFGDKLRVMNPRSAKGQQLRQQAPLLTQQRCQAQPPDSSGAGAPRASFVPPRAYRPFSLSEPSTTPVRPSVQLGCSRKP